MGLLLYTTGCLIGTSSQVRRDGPYVAEDTLRKIEPGKTEKAWVLATLGEPTEKNELDPGHELWKYSCRETRDSSGYVFLIFGSSDQKVTQEKVFVEMKDGVVTKSWRG
jgi:outer membrane protein assembly factor BamE (lipoprotein component of BamABCDE complex)